jgi:hypothetical protein
VSRFRLAQVRGETHRLINSRYPTIGVFDDLDATPVEIEAAFRAEMLTNPRLDPAIDRLRGLPPGAMVQGESASIVMAAFIHASPEGGRFTGPDLGGWYAACDLDTAVAETVHHNTRRLAASTGGFPNRIQLRELLAQIDMPMADLRGADAAPLLDPASHAAGQAFAAAVRWPRRPDGLEALVYPSVRRAGGENICIFRPSAVPRPIVQGCHLEYRWDATGALTVERL